MSWLDEYRLWSADRAAQTAAEDAGKADPDQWAYIDDAGCDLAERAAEGLAALVDLAGAFRDTGRHFTCSEADRFAEVLRLVSDDLADGFMFGHADGDDPREGDSHEPTLTAPFWRHRP
jgi:hypothetical protein